MGLKPFLDPKLPCDRNSHVLSVAGFCRKDPSLCDFQEGDREIFQFFLNKFTI
jgi:hypothetical protein